MCRSSAGLAAAGEQAGKSETLLAVSDDLCPAVGQPIFLGPGRAGVKNNIGTRYPELTPQFFSRALDSLGEMQRKNAFRNEISQELNEVEIMIGRMFFPHRRLYEMRVNPGACSPFGDETEPDPLCCLRKKRDQRRAVIAGEVQAEIESASDKVEPEIERLRYVGKSRFHSRHRWLAPARQNDDPA